MSPSNYPNLRVIKTDIIVFSLNFVTKIRKFKFIKV